MKLRSDFITNSSSAIYIIAVNEIPESVSELKDLLFRDSDVLIYGSEEHDLLQVADFLFKLDWDIIDQKCIKSRLRQFATGMSIEKVNNMYLTNASFDEINKTHKLLRTRSINRFLARNKRKKFIEIELNDNNEYDQMCIESEVFKNVPHLEGHS
jgi:hypothetical protein